MKICDLNYLSLIDSKIDVIGGNAAELYWPNWLQNFPQFSGNSASASFFASATGDNTYTDVQATLITTENSSYSSVQSVAISSS
ncbi:MAG: hypothetical protein WBA13_22725 [Microcoleaceae cyanobacterium]